MSSPLLISSDSYFGTCQVYEIYTKRGCSTHFHSRQRHEVLLLLDGRGSDFNDSETRFDGLWV